MLVDPTSDQIEERKNRLLWPCSEPGCSRAVQSAGKAVSEKPFKPCAGIKERLSMRAVNPYQYDARPPPDLDFTLFD